MEPDFIILLIRTIIILSIIVLSNFKSLQSKLTGLCDSFVSFLGNHWDYSVWSWLNRVLLIILKIKYSLQKRCDLLPDSLG